MTMNSFNNRPEAQKRLYQIYPTYINTHASSGRTAANILRVKIQQLFIEQTRMAPYMHLGANFINIECSESVIGEIKSQFANLISNVQSVQVQKTARPGMSRRLGMN